MQINTQNRAKSAARYSTKKIALADGKSTTVHIARYQKSAIQPAIHLFHEPVYLEEWCQEHSYSDAINGGFFIRSDGRPLGEVWQAGKRVITEKFGHGWHGKRGSICVTKDGELLLRPRNTINTSLIHDLLEAGPTLVSHGISTFSGQTDPEGFSETAYQHDEDINVKRHPRAAIGCSDKYVWTVTVDGRTNKDSGMFLSELAQVFIDLGASEAINLDGGSSSSQVMAQKLINRPRTTTPGMHGKSQPMEVVDNLDGKPVYQSPFGFKVHNALVLN